ncbi:MAG: hypothetical protein Q8K79_03330 [Solirubrobacteraceae bacterium]|nr:hypothetical protein [Solirubrobacteraceae bacterium]
MTLSLRRRFAQLADELRNDPRIDVLAVELPAPAGDAEIAAAATVIGGRSDALARFYAELDGFTLRWRLRDASDHGTVELLPLAELVKDWRGVTWFEDRDEYRGVRPWDFFAPEACAALVDDAGAGGLRGTVHYHYLGEVLCDTGHGIDAFLDRLIAARGYWYWVEALCPAMRGSPEAQRFLERMPELFDDFDAGFFEPVG